LPDRVKLQETGALEAWPDINGDTTEVELKEKLKGTGSTRKDKAKRRIITETNRLPEKVPTKEGLLKGGLE